MPNPRHDRFIAFVHALNPNQQEYMLYDLPRLTVEYIRNAANLARPQARQPQPSERHPLVLSYSAYGAFIAAWHHARQFFPPVASANQSAWQHVWMPDDIMRAIHVQLPMPQGKQTAPAGTRAQTITLSAWSLNQPTHGRTVLHTRLQGTRHILFDFASARSLVEGLANLDLPRVISPRARWLLNQRFGVVHSNDEAAERARLFYSQCLSSLNPYMADRQCVLYLKTREYIQCQLLMIPS